MGQLVHVQHAVASYDAANKSVNDAINGSSVAYGCDGLGRRVSQKVDGALTDAWYDLTGLMLETGANNAIYVLAVSAVNDYAITCTQRADGGTMEY